MILFFGQAAIAADLNKIPGNKCHQPFNSNTLPFDLIITDAEVIAEEIYKMVGLVE